jgi:hypothetical protein
MSVKPLQQLEQDQTDTDMSLELSQWWNDATSSEYIDADRARELGVDNPSLLDANQEDRTEIPLWEVLPEAAKKKYTELIDKYGKNISGYGSRQRWVNDKTIAGQEVYDKLIASQRQEFFKESIVKQDRSINAAVQAGDFSLARSLASSHPDVASREDKLLDIDFQEETAGVHNTVQSENIKDMLAYADQLSDPEYKGPFNEVQQTAAINLLKSSAQRLIDKQEASRIRQFDQLRTQYTVARDTEAPEAWSLLSEMYHYLDRTGNMDYVSKSYFASEWGKLAKAEVNRSQDQDVGMAFLMGDYSNFDVTDREHKAAADKVVEAELSLAADVDREAGGNQAMEYTNMRLLEASSRSGYIPSHYRNAIMDLNLPNVSTEDAIEASKYYNYLSSKNPSLLSELPDNVRQTAAEVYSLSMAGKIDVDTVANIQQRYRDTDENTLNAREREFNSMYQDQKRPIDKYLENKIEGWSSVVPNFIMDWFGKDATGAISDTSFTDFSMLTRHYMLNGSPPDQAMGLAWEDWSNNHQPSNVNGSPQFMRHSPEITTGMPSEDIRTDFHSYLQESIMGFEGNPKDYYMYPDVRTASTGDYQIYYKDPETGEIQMVMDPAVGYLRYKPNTKRMRERSLGQDIKSAKAKRALSEAGYQGATKLYGNIPKSFDERKLRYEARRVEKMERKLEEKEKVLSSRRNVVDERAREISSERQILEDMSNE